MFDRLSRAARVDAALPGCRRARPPCGDTLERAGRARIVFTVSGYWPSFDEFGDAFESIAGVRERLLDEFGMRHSSLNESMGEALVRAIFRCPVA
jgi:hypothetical protein